MPILWDGARPRRPDRGLPVVVRPSGSSTRPLRSSFTTNVRYGAAAIVTKSLKRGGVLDQP